MVMPNRYKYCLLWPAYRHGLFHATDSQLIRSRSQLLRVCNAGY
uniref:Uncharacterized protein n=1 Tax=Rhizophora mucronata TaxID=61149 RepID=A0A2P2QBV7_RHIMU